jgi:hypothetical protein
VSANILSLNCSLELLRQCLVWGMVAQEPAHARAASILICNFVYQIMKLSPTEQRFSNANVAQQQTRSRACVLGPKRESVAAWRLRPGAGTGRESRRPFSRMQRDVGANDRFSVWPANTNTRRHKPNQPCPDPVYTRCPMRLRPNP